VPDDYRDDEAILMFGAPWRELTEQQRMTFELGQGLDSSPLVETRENVWVLLRKVLHTDRLSAARFGIICGAIADYGSYHVMRTWVPTMFGRGLAPVIATAIGAFLGWVFFDGALEHIAFVRRWDAEHTVSDPFNEPQDPAFKVRLWAALVAIAFLAAIWYFHHAPTCIGPNGCD